MKWNKLNKKSGRFINPHLQGEMRGFFYFFLWQLGFYKDEISQRQAPANFSYPAQAELFNRDLPSAIWIGHSTYLIRVGGLNFLTDPVFSSHCSPIPMRGFKRRHPPALSLEELPPIDCVLLSHNHYDHMDEKSIRQIVRAHPKAVWIVPEGVKAWFAKRGIERVEELSWGETAAVGSAKIHSVPAQHFSGRTLWDKNCTLWCGYVVECKKKTFYFVGDTGYNPIDFKEIGEKWTPDLSLIPIGTYSPKSFMQPVHINPYEAVEIHLDVGSRKSLGMHWNTFVLSDEPMDLPPYDLYLAMKEKNLPFDTFLPVQPGEHVNW